jgi:hypothetical protein
MDEFIEKMVAASVAVNSALRPPKSNAGLWEQLRNNWTIIAFLLAAVLGANDKATNIENELSNLQASQNEMKESVESMDLKVDNYGNRITVLEGHMREQQATDARHERRIDKVEDWARTATRRAKAAPAGRTLELPVLE